MKVNIIKNNFSTGEISPFISLRTDLIQYQNGCKSVENMLAIIEGGIKRRGGTEFILNTNNAIRIIPFILSTTKSYIFAFREKAVDIYTKDGALVITLETPYLLKDIDNINYCQDKYNLYLTHGDYPFAWIRSSEDLTNWEYDIIRFAVPPMEDTGSPKAILTPSDKDVGKTIRLTARQYEQWNSTRVYQVGEIAIFRGIYYRARRQNQNRPPYVDSGAEGPHQDETNWQVVTVGEANVFKPTDVGKFIFINSGIVRIDVFENASNVLGEVLLKLTSVVEAIEGAWVIKENVFNENLGYPRAVSMYQQRLVLAGTKKYPNYIWLSRVGDVLNFLPTTNDGDSFTVSASSEQLTNVLHLAQSRGILAMCGGSEMVISAQNAMTPTNTTIMEHTTYGISEKIRPLKVGNEVIFVQRGNERVRSLVYDYAEDGLISNELSLLASHIGEDHGGFVAMTYQQEPDSIIWFAMGDGSLASLTINKSQQVNSWGRHDIGGKVISLITLPNDIGADRVYFLVERDGIRTIERLNEDLLLDIAKEVTVIDGLVTDPLITQLGNKVRAYYKKDNTIFMVNIKSIGNNVISVDKNLSGQKIYIGEQFTSKVSLLAPELSQNPTTTNPALVKINMANFYLYKSINPYVNGQVLELKNFDDNPLAPTKEFTGLKRMEMTGWNTFETYHLEVSQPNPLPLHITAISLELNINDR